MKEKEESNIAIQAATINTGCTERGETQQETLSWCFINNTIQEHHSIVVSLFVLNNTLIVWALFIERGSVPLEGGPEVSPPIGSVSVTRPASLSSSRLSDSKNGETERGEREREKEIMRERERKVKEGRKKNTKR